MATIVDGKKISQGLIAELAERRKEIQKPIHLAAVLVGNDLGSIHYLKQKGKAAEKIGVGFEVIKFPETIATQELKEKVRKISKEPKNNGVIVQLPLPRHIKTDAILDSVPKEKDVDVLAEESVGAFLDGHSKILPPVVGAIELILLKHHVNPKGKFVVIVGAGRLVGIPAAVWFSHQGALTSVIPKAERDTNPLMRQAEIVVCGSGRPRSITGEMLREGVVVLDAGYEVVGGKPVGDVDFESVAPKASLITPVPGGIGPITVAMLFKNLITLAKLQA